MDLATFKTLKTEDIAALVRDRGPRVVVCPINGTRRWFALESGKRATTGDFLDTILERYVSLFEMFFSHGVSTLLTPILGPDIVQRGSAYTRMVFEALGRISSGEMFRKYYDQQDVRVRFYGDYEPYLEEHAPDLLEKLRNVQSDTREHLAHRLFWGMFANDPSEKIARQAVAHFREHGEAPKRPAIVTNYYGEYLPPADIFIGMMPPSVFDFPLLDTGHTALYFTVAPTPYLNEKVFRSILHDYMYTRRLDDDYADLNESAWRKLDEFYTANRETVHGTGKRSEDGRFWLPDGYR